jgi:hypothetical protein
MAMLRLQQRVKTPSSTRFVGCFSRYFNMGNITAQINRARYTYTRRHSLRFQPRSRTKHAGATGTRNPREGSGVGAHR